MILGAGTISREAVTTLSTTGSTRLLEGVVLYKSLEIPIIFCGGRTIQGADWPSEAEAAVRIMKKLGIAETDIYMEETSRNTYENLENMIEKFNPDSIVLVTSAYHMPRAMSLIEDYPSLQVSPYSVDYKTEDRNYSLLDFFPSMGALYSSYRALHEYTGLIYYALRYRFS